MKSPNIRFELRLILALVGAVLAANAASAQLSPPASQEQAAENDKNRKDRIDADKRAAMETDREKTKTGPRTASSGEVVVLSPFEVVGEDRGYYASSTMSGTRLNSKVEDLASAVSVVTKQQMADFALLDLNDIFLYEANTEGSGTFTDISANSDGVPVDNTQLNPNGANRIRGVSSANISFGNYQTSGRVPVDPINIDAVEVNRGPNSNVFGLGNAGGTINMQPASANLIRNRAQVSVRGDSFDGYRSSLDINRVLKKGVLAVRGSAVYQHDGFNLKPSGTDTSRLNGMVKYQPFKLTSLTMNYSRYHNEGTRPNTTTPIDGVTGWLKAGRPTWDPVTSRAHLNGATLGPFTTSNLPSYFATSSASSSGIAYSQVWVDQGGQVVLWTPTRTTSSTTDPNASRQNVFFAVSSPEPVKNGQPLWASEPTVSSKDIYDWSSINLAAPNFLSQTTTTAFVNLEQIFLNSTRQLLAMQGGFFLEEGDSYARNTIGSAGSSGRIGRLHIDVNERLVNGQPNPYFLSPYIGVSIPTSIDQPISNQTGRVQVAYKIDLRKEKSALRWLGMHQVSAYGEYRDAVRRQITYRDIIADDHSWLQALPRATVNAAQGGGIDPARNYFRYYVGDASGNNVDTAPRAFASGIYPYTWGNGLTGNFKNETALLAAGVAADGTGATLNTHQIVKTQGVVLQSYLLRDRVVTTVGVRRDSSYNKFGVTPVFLADASLDRDVWNSWAGGDWALSEGTTKTYGVVVKAKPWLHFHANASSSFQPAQAALTIYERPLLDPTGKGKDYGFTLNLFDGKLIAKVNQYETTQIDARAGATAAARTRSIDFDFASGSTNRDQWLSTHARRWVLAAAGGATLSEDQIITRMAAIMKIDRSYLDQKTPNSVISETADITAKGTEIELHYNPTDFWTAKLNVVRQESLSTNLSPNVTQWIGERLPIWKGIIDPDTGMPWFTTRYSGSTASASEFLSSTVLVPLSVDKALEGKSRPQVRKYRLNLSTSFRLAGITEQKIMKRFTVGGALRWEDRGAIGFYGVESLPAVVTALDANRPIYDEAHLYADAFVSYRTRIFRDRIGATFQLNVRNLQESGRLQPVQAYPDGTPWAYRIVDPRQFIVTATFDL